MDFYSSMAEDQPCCCPDLHGLTSALTLTLCDSILFGGSLLKMLHIVCLSLSEFNAYQWPKPLSTNSCSLPYHLIVPHAVASASADLLHPSGSSLTEWAAYMSQPLSTFACVAQVSMELLSAVPFTPRLESIHAAYLSLDFDAACECPSLR